MNNVLERLKKYKNADGYVKYLSSPITKNDVFINKDLEEFEFRDVPVEVIAYGNAEGEKRSFKAVLINGEYRIDEEIVDNLENDVESYYSVFEGLKVKMKQIWKPEKDLFEEEFEEYSPVKVVFGGFEGEIK